MSYVVGCRTESWEALGTTVLVLTYSDRAAEVRAAVGDELDAIDRAVRRFGARAAVPVAPSGLRFAVAAALVAGAEPPPCRCAPLAPSAREGWELDFGATAQAMATDRAAQVGESVGGEAVLVAVGGDVAARGSPPSGWWTIRALEPGSSWADWTVSLRSGGVATSSLQSSVSEAATEAWAANAAWLAASVAAGSCVEAKVAAAAVLGLGLSAPHWLEEHRLAARLVARDGTVVTLGGWPGDTVQPR